MNIAFLYAGQGAQSVGMAKDFYDAFDSVKELCHQANDILGFELTKVMFRGPERLLKDTKITQPAVFLQSIIIDRLLRERGIIPQYLAGHSIGEYSALVCGGSISFEDGLKLVKQRGLLMSEAGNIHPGKMLAIGGLSAVKINEICQNISNAGHVVNVANDNSQIQVVVAGEPEAVKMVERDVIGAGATKTMMLPVSGAFHSSLMQEAQEKFQCFLKDTDIKDLTIPIITNTGAEVILKKEDIIAELQKQMLLSVQWHKSILKLFEFDVNVFVEVGPGKILRGRLLEIDPRKSAFSTFSIHEFEYTIKSIESWKEQ